LFTILFDSLWQTLPYFISSSRMPCSERSKNNSIIFSSSIITPPPFRLHLYTTVSTANTTSNPKIFQKNYITLLEWGVAGCLNVLSPLFHASSFLRPCYAIGAFSRCFLRLLTVKHRLAHILRFLLPVPCKRSSALPTS